MVYSISKLVPIAMVIFFLAQDISTMARSLDTRSTTTTLVARLKLDKEGQQSNCWDSLFQLQSCTGEVVLFFLNGETYLGPACCRAIKVIERDCWPAMLGSLGYTSEEGDILRGYCNATDALPKPPLPTH